MYKCFWKAVPDEENIHECQSCGFHRRQNIKSGYSNLFNHMKNAHAQDWEGVLRVFMAGGRGPLDGFVVKISRKASSLYGWMEWILEGGHSFSFCESKFARKNTTLDNLSTNSLMKYIKLTAAAVKEKVKLILPPSFGIVIDGWTQDSDHFSAIFAVFVREGSPDNVQEILLSCNVAADITEETEFDENLQQKDKFFGFTAEDWFDVIVEVLFEYGIEMNVHNAPSIIEYISADNCSTNRSLCTRTSMYSTLSTM